jgi:hypothetical protein
MYVMKYDYDTSNLKLEELDIIKYRVSVSPILI